MPDALLTLFARNVGRRVVVLLENFPYFFIGRIVTVRLGVVVVRSLEGLPIQLIDRNFRVPLSGIAAFWIETESHPIPSLGSLSLKVVEGTPSCGDEVQEDDLTGPRDFFGSLKAL
ncbi:MAG: hypothetical protein K6U08_05890, partial [Firmicutes bacterium]|nr:hypothetical protein [Bacillota bacterium]